MRHRQSFLVALLLILAACGTNSRLEERLVGHWIMDKVIEQGVDVTAEHNPQANRWIRFNKDGSFKSGGDPFGDNSGSYEIENNRSILYIYSSEEDDNSEWNIQIEGNEMTWTGIGTQRKEGFKLIFSKSEN
jgi:hypothetical protein